VIAFIQILVRLLSDLVGLVALSVSGRRSTEAEILLLRRQLALYQERRIKPRRVDAATRASLAFSRSCLIGAMRWWWCAGDLDPLASSRMAVALAVTSRDQSVRPFRSNNAS